MDTLYENLLDKEIDCECGRKHYIPIKRIVISKGAINQLSAVIKQLGFKDNFHIVVDKNTLRVAAARVVQLLKEQSANYSVTIFDEDELLASMENSEKIRKDIKAETSLIIAIGSGTINDLCRYTAFMTGLPYIIVATAPSMDGYASSVSPLIFNGFKRTYSAVPPIAIIGDTDILKEAPSQMIEAGFGDLIGKYISLCDWRLGKCINGEYHCVYVESIVNKALIMCVDNINNLKARNEKSVADLMNGLVLSGLGMLMIGDSRPCSGAEHHLAHFWEMIFLSEGRKNLLHGLKVGVSSVFMAELYNSLKKQDIDEILDNFLSSRPKTEEEKQKNIRAVYGAIADEVINENFNELSPPRNINELIMKWSEILNIAKKVPDSTYIKSLLEFIGAPSTPEQMGIDKQLKDMGMKNCMYVRKRYTILRLFEELGLSTKL